MRHAAGAISHMPCAMRPGGRYSRGQKASGEGFRLPHPHFRGPVLKMTPVALSAVPLSAALRTRLPVGEEGKKVGRAAGVVAVERTTTPGR